MLEKNVYPPFGVVWKLFKVTMTLKNNFMTALALSPQMFYHQQVFTIVTASHKHMITVNPIQQPPPAEGLVSLTYYIGMSKIFWGSPRMSKKYTFLHTHVLTHSITHIHG